MLVGFRLGGAFDLVAQGFLALGLDFLLAAGGDQQLFLFFLQAVLPRHRQLGERLLDLDHALLVLRVGIDVGDPRFHHLDAELAELLLLAYRDALGIGDLLGDELAGVVVAERSLLGAGLEDRGLVRNGAARPADFLALDQVQAVVELVLELGGEFAAGSGVVVVGAHQRSGGLEGFLDRRHQCGADEIVRVAVFLGHLQERLAAGQAKARGRFDLGVDVAEEHDRESLDGGAEAVVVRIGVVIVHDQHGLHADGLLPGGGATEPLGRVADVIDDLLVAEDGPYVGHEAGFVIEEHAVEQAEAEGEHAEGGGDELDQVSLRDDHDHSLMRGGGARSC